MQTIGTHLECRLERNQQAPLGILGNDQHVLDYVTLLEVAAAKV